ncbi:uncharacterized protein [Clytia hemisphaerica]|uniref:Uncharacterized protein n=1 Tax=Clytia hemisphaerica TaxID=252671 RepID=A0A7M5WTD9_9CNID
MTRFCFSKFVSGIFMVTLPIYIQGQQIRRISEISGRNVFYGYANMVAHQGHILNVTALQTITINITSPAKCITNCIDVENCNSVNVIIGQNLECQLLDTDRFRNSSYFMPQTQSTHYAINHDCEWDETCINPNHKCIPDYQNGTHECVCLFQTYDEYCMFELTDNIALHKTVSMSSVLSNFVGSICTDGAYGLGVPFCHTGLAHSNWLRIDLGSLKIITFLVIHNRVNLNEYILILERLAHNNIYVFNNGNPNDNRRLCSRIGDTKAGVYMARCIKPLLARNVELLQLDIGFVRPMNLAEIMVY